MVVVGIRAGPPIRGEPHRFLMPEYIHRAIFTTLCGTLVPIETPLGEAPSWQKRTGGRLMAIVFLAVSFFAALVVFGLMWVFLSGLQHNLDQMSKGSDQIEVVVAARDLHQGMALTAEDLQIKKIPRAYIPDTVYHSLTDVEGRTPRERILKGEAVRQERLAQPAAGRGLNAIIPTGQRAQQIELAGAASVGGFINPGNFVDILVTGNDSNGMGQTTTLLQAVKVLAVDDRLETQGRGRTHQSSGSLALTPYDAQRLTEAVAIETSRQPTKRRRCHERSRKGMKPSMFIGTSKQRVSIEELNQKRAPAPAKPASPKAKTVIIQGQNRSEIEQ